MKTFLALALSASCLLAHQESILTDSKLMGLAQAGVSEAELLRMVSVAPKFDFDLQPVATEAMMKAGLSERVIKAMAARENGETSTRTVSDGASHFVSASAITTKPSPIGSVPGSPAAVKIQRQPPAKGTNHTIYVLPDNGFESAIVAAIANKHVPVTVVPNREGADYVLGAVGVQIHKETTGGKIARCLFAYCAGIEDSGNVSVELLDTRTETIVWGYNVTKERAARNEQSMAEAIAKHLKNGFLKHQAVPH